MEGVSHRGPAEKSPDGPGMLGVHQLLLFDVDARQAQCPLFDIFWQKRDDSEGFGVKRERQRQSGAGFWPFPRYLSREEVKKDRGMLIMGNLVWEYIIPEVCLMPLYHVDFLVLAKKIVDANPERSLSIGMMRRIWRVLVKEVYDFVQEPERTAKLLEVSFPLKGVFDGIYSLNMQADTTTDDKQSEMAGLIPENLSKKRERTPEKESETVRSQRRRHRSRKKKTVKLAEAEVAEGQISKCRRSLIRALHHAYVTVASERDVGLAARPDHPTETNDQQSNLEPPSFLSQDVLDETKRIAVLETKLRDASREVAAANERATAAERQSANHERERARMDQKLQSQAGQLRAAEQRIRELSKAKKHASENGGARRALQYQSKSLNGQLKKVTRSEQVRRAERDKLGASLTKAGLDAKGKE